MVKLEGPFPLNTSFNSVAGVYLIGNVNNNVVDVGQTSDLKQRMSCHEREACWNRNGATKLWFVQIHDISQRLAVESNLREQYRPACGIR